MTNEQLCRVSHYLFVLDTYLFGKDWSEDQRAEIAGLQKAISNALRTGPEGEAWVRPDLPMGGTVFQHANPLDRAILQVLGSLYPLRVYLIPIRTQETIWHFRPNAPIRHRRTWAAWTGHQPLVTGRNSTM